MPSGTPSPRSAHTRRFDRPPSAAMSNAVSLLAVGLGDDQRRVVGRDGHAVGERDAVGHLPSRAVGRDQRDDPGGELAAREVEADAVDVGVAATVDDDLVPRRDRESRLRSAWVTSEPSGSRRRSSPSRRRDDQQPPVGQPVDAHRKRRRRERPPRSCPSRSTAMISCAPQSENHSRPSCQRGDSANARPVIRVCSSGTGFPPPGLWVPN